MKILIATSGFYKSGGGISTYTRQLSLLLSKKEHNVFVITTDSENDGELNDISFNRIKIFSFPVPEQHKKESSYAKKIFSFIEKRKFDIVISSDHITVSSLFPYLSNSTIKISVSHFYNGIIARAAAVNAPYCDWIVALSNAGKDFLSNIRGVDKNQIKVIYNGMSDSKSAKVYLDNKLKEIKRLKLVYPGGSNKKKNPSFVYRLAKLLYKTDLPIDLIWLGKADKYMKKIKNTRNFNIHFTGFVDHQQAVEIISSSHIFLLPSKGEGSPMSLIEATRAGVIPIVSDCPSAMREIVKNNVNGFVVSKNEIKKAFHIIEKLSNDSNKVNLLLKNSRELYESFFEESNWIMNMESLFVKRVKLKKISYNAIGIYKWHRRPGKWYRPTRSYINNRFGIVEKL